MLFSEYIMRSPFWTKTLASLCTIALSSVLVFSFGLHTVELEHTHPGEHAHATTQSDGGVTMLGEYLHGTEKKIFLYAVLGFLLLGIFIGVTARATTLIRTNLEHVVRVWSTKHSVLFHRSCNYLLLSLSAGIQNPKLY